MPSCLGDVRPWWQGAFLDPLPGAHSIWESKDTSKWPILDIHGLSRSYWKRAFVFLAAKAQEYPEEVPACITEPLLEISNALQCKPVISYASTVLLSVYPDSCSRLKVLKTLSKANEQETHFYKVSYEIEIILGEALLEGANSISKADELLSEALKAATRLFNEQLPQGLDPATFHSLIHPMLGVPGKINTYGEIGVERKFKRADGFTAEMTLSGATAGQSPSLRLLDELTRDQKRTPKTQAYIRGMYACMLGEHRDTIQTLSKLYNGIGLPKTKAALMKWRVAHLAMVRQFLKATPSSPSKTDLIEGSAGVQDVNGLLENLIDG